MLLANIYSKEKGKFQTEYVAFDTNENPSERLVLNLGQALMRERGRFTRAKLPQEAQTVNQNLGHVLVKSLHTQSRTVLQPRVPSGPALMTESER